MRAAGIHARRRQRGFTLISALFLLTVIAAAGAYMVRVGSLQRQTTTYALLGAKAHHAARSGIEWKLNDALTTPASCPAGATTTDTFALTEAGLAGFQLTVTCQADVHDEAGVARTRFHIVAFAERGTFGARDYVSRRLETTVSDG